jgi:DNA-binding XRE family transcriptional regulator
MPFCFFLIDEGHSGPAKGKVIAVPVRGDHLLDVLTCHAPSLTYCRFFSVVILTYNRCVPRQSRQASRYIDQAARLSSIIRRARNDAGLTQFDVASKSGVPYSTVRAIERARVNEPCFFAVLEICAAINLKPAKLAQLLKARRIPAAGEEDR